MVRRELVDRRIAGARGDTGGVWFEGPLTMGMEVCLHSRAAMRVLVEVGRFPAHDADSLYEGARSLDWSLWLNARTTLAVSADVRDAPALHHSGFAALKVKDAIVDALRERLGARPNVAPHDPDVAVRLHLASGEARLFLDLAGEPLHRRHYRVAMTEAPLKENLAAAVLALGRVAPDQPFVDPLGGSGTFAIEHALAARRIAPGLGRSFGFERWPAFAEPDVRTAWDRLRESARAAAQPAAPAPILCSDRDPKAIEAARRNAAAAGVAGDVVFSVASVRDLQRAWPEGNLCTNPPYGERLLGGEDTRVQNPGRAPKRGSQFVNPDSRSSPEPRDSRDLRALYRDLWAACERLSGWGVVLLSGNPLLAREVRRKPVISHRLWNGPLEVRLLRFETPEISAPSGPAGGARGTAARPS